MENGSGTISPILNCPALVRAAAPNWVPHLAAARKSPEAPWEKGMLVSVPGGSPATCNGVPWLIVGYFAGGEQPHVGLAGLRMRIGSGGGSECWAHPPHGLAPPLPLPDSTPSPSLPVCLPSPPCSVHPVGNSQASDTGAVWLEITLIIES